MVDLLIIGFDGGDFTLVKTLLESGELDNLGKIYSRGMFSKLISTEIPITPCAWTSMLTGKNPGKHGIWDFVTPPPTGSEVVTAEDVTEPTIFDLISPELSVGSLNVPVTFPPEAVSGTTVSGMLTPTVEQCSNDSKVIDLLQKSDYTIEVPLSYNGENEEDLLDECKYTLNKRTNVAVDLINEWDFDVFMPVFTVGDRVSHWFWKYHNPDHPDHTSSPYESAITNIYRRIDRSIGQVLSAAGGLNDVNVIVVSDHGFTSLSHGLNVNQKFIEDGVLSIKSSCKSRLKYKMNQAGVTPENLYSLLDRGSFTETIKEFADNPEKADVREFFDGIFFSFEDVNLTQSAAFSSMTYGPIFLIDETRKEEVIASLEGIYHQGTKVISDIYDTDDLYTGNELANGPDIVFQTKNMNFLPHRYFEFGSNSVVTDPFNKESGYHDIEGIFLAAGPKVKPKGNGQQASIYDVAPTVLSGIGVDIPGDIDGDAIDLFKDTV